MTKIASQFELNYSKSDALMDAARSALQIALNLKPGERLLIMSNPDGNLPEIAKAVYNAALNIGADPVLLFQPARSRLDLSDPSTIGAIATEPDVLFTITLESLGNDPNGLRKPYQLGNLTFNHIFYYLIAIGKARGAWCPSADIETFCRAVPINYPDMWVRAKRLKNIIDSAKAVHLTTPAGTDLWIDLNGREGMLDDGDYRYPGSGGNLPAGEVFAIPTNKSHGIAVIDGSAAVVGGTIKVKTPFSVIIEDGKFKSVSGAEEAQIFQKTIDQMKTITEIQIEEGIISPDQAETYRRNCRNLAEFGIGLNPSARLIGNMTEDEKVFNTCHIAFGDDCYGLAPAVDHFDVVMLRPQYEFHMENGSVQKIDPLNPDEIT